MTGKFSTMAFAVSVLACAQAAPVSLDQGFRNVPDASKPWVYWWWVNRLIGDAGQPKDRRITQTNIALQKGQRTIKVYQGFASSDPLMRSGLLGPVRLELLP